MDRRRQSFGTNAEAERAGPRFRAVIISEVRLVSDGLTEALNSHREIVVIGCFVDVTATLAHFYELQPNTILIDAAGRDGPSSVICLRAAAPQAKIVAVAVADTIDDIVAWAEAGVAGYIPRTVPLSAVGPVLIEILQGEQACSTRVAAGLMRRLCQVADTARDRSEPAKVTLTMREKQIAELLCAGFSNKHIARQLNIGLGTTKSHVHHLLQKLNVQRRSQVLPLVQRHQMDHHPPS